MTLAELLRDTSPPQDTPGARETLRSRLASSSSRIAVVDDDPTGTQTVQDVWVTLDWSPAVLREAAPSPEPVFYVSVNSRALDAAACEALSLEVGGALRSAADGAGTRLILASRSDSTLRGHFPAELIALCRGMGAMPRAVLLAPAFFEGGRFTVGNVHYVEQGGQAVPAAETEFARDPTFGYRASDLREWVEEKTGGAVPSRDVVSLSLELIRRGGPEAVAEALREACARPPATTAAWPLGPVVVVNAACYQDLDVVSLAASAVEAEGIPLAYRCAASFVKSRGGFGDEPLLRGARLGATAGPGLVVVGSYVQKTSRQLETLLGAGAVEAVELDVDRLADAARSDAAVATARERIDASLRSGRTAAVYTSRSTHLTSRPGFLDVGRSVMRGLCASVGGLRERPAWIVAKGCITSIEVARRALGVRRARVLGQIANGVPVWRLGDESAAPGAPYVVFPGNVGDERTLLEVVSILTERERSTTT
jgi:uncharacterized protein YgbK (DUF1537 family)